MYLYDLFPLNDSLGEQPQFVYDETGKITGYTTKTGGADTVFPFSSGCRIEGEVRHSDRTLTWKDQRYEFKFETNGYKFLCLNDILVERSSSDAYANLIIYGDDTALKTYSPSKGVYTENFNSDLFDISSYNEIKIIMTTSYAHDMYVKKLYFFS